jgi:hypothetical protein
MGHFKEVVVDIGGAGDYESEVDAKIRRSKELYRSVMEPYHGSHQP